MLQKLKALYLRYREIIVYVFFGGLTTLLNWATFWLCNGVLGAEQTLSNAVAWVAGLIFAFVVNKRYVFESRNRSVRTTVREALSFVGGRIFSGVIEIAGPTVLVELGLDQTLFGLDGLLAKLIISVFVVILNYIFSKFFVFTGDGKGAGRVARIVYAVLCLCAVVWASVWYGLHFVD